MRKKRSNTLTNRIGQIRKNSFGSIMEVIEYNSNLDIVVKFKEYGNLVHTNWKAFDKGNVRNVYDKSVYGVGYLGEGEHKTNKNGKITSEYASWCNMLKRCYNEDYLNKHPSYKGCIVCEEWLNFQNYADWYNNNYYNIENEIICLDKDIIKKGNKIYSPDTCVFVPDDINKLFLKRNVKRGSLPIGVNYDKTDKKYKASCSVPPNITKSKKRIINLGRYIDPKEAFYAYKSFKEKLIKQIANEYKGKIPTKLYEAMLLYNIELDD